jgi:hypothetical protein
MHRITRLLALAALLSLCAIAQTTVTGTLELPPGDRLTGNCVIQSMTAVSTPSGIRIIQGASVTVPFTAGLLSVSLFPTDTAVPGGAYYQVTCNAGPQTVNGRKIQPVSWPQKIWRVPTSATPVDISAVEVPDKPPAPGMINFSQINFSGLGNGCLSILNGSGTVFSCGALAAGLTWTQQKAYTWTQF